MYHYCPSYVKMAEINCACMTLLVILLLHWTSGETNICHKVVKTTTSTCPSITGECPQVPQHICDDQNEPVNARPIEVHAVSQEDCVNALVYPSSANTSQKECTYMVYSILQPNNICEEGGKHFNSSLCGPYLVIRRTVYCVPLGIYVAVDKNLTRVFGDFAGHLLINPHRTVQLTGTRYVVISSHPGIIPGSINQLTDADLYNMTALYCAMTVYQNYEVSIGGFGFEMSEIEAEEESCLMISDSLTVGPTAYYVCNNNTANVTAEPFILPCQSENRTVEITYTGPNNAWFFLPVGGSDDHAFKISCSVGAIENEEVFITELQTTALVTSSGDTMPLSTTTLTANSPPNVQGTTMSISDSSDSSITIIIVCALGGLLIAVVLITTVVCCCCRRKKPTPTQEPNQAMDNPVYAHEQQELARYATHIEAPTGYRVQNGGMAGHLSQEDKVYQVDVEMPTEGKKFDIRQQTAVLTDSSGLYAVPNLSTKKSRRTNSSRATSERQSDFGSLGWDNRGISEEPHGESLEMVDNDVYMTGDPY